jgi:hypothetical protein
MIGFWEFEAHRCPAAAELGRSVASEGRTVRTTFVALNDPRRGFWLSDSVLELWLRFLALHGNSRYPTGDTNA